MSTANKSKLLCELNFLHMDVHNYSVNYAFCLTTVPQPLPKILPHTVRSRTFNFQYHLISLTSLSSCILPLPRLSATYILPSIFPSISCFRRQSLRKM